MQEAEKDGGSLTHDTRENGILSKTTESKVKK